MNKGCYGSLVGIIIAQFKDCDNRQIFKSLLCNRLPGNNQTFVNIRIEERLFSGLF